MRSSLYGRVILLGSAFFVIGTVCQSAVYGQCTGTETCWTGAADGED